MINIELGQMISACLLIGRFVASYYLVKVISVQRGLLRYPAVNEYGVVDDDVMHFRRTLSRMTLVILLGQVIPITLDIFHTLVGNTPSWLIYIYAISNTISAVTASLLIWRLYEMAVHVKNVNELEKAHLKKDVK